MVQATNVIPLTEFKRNTAQVREQMEASHQPFVLTVDGRAAMVVMDPHTYQRMAELAEKAEVQQAIRDGLADVDAGRTRSWEEFEREMRSRYKLPPQP